VDTQLAVVLYWDLNHHHAREYTMSIKITCTSTHPDTGSACVLQGEEHDDHGGHHWDGFISTWTDDETATASAIAEILEQPVDFEAIGRQAALNDEPAAPAANATVQAALEGRQVGDPETTSIMQAFSKGYQSVRDAEAQAVLDEEAYDMPLTGTDEFDGEIPASTHTITDRDIREHVVEPLLGEFAADYDIEAIMADLFARWPRSEWTYAELHYDHADFDADAFTEILQRHDRTADQFVQVHPLQTVLVWLDSTVEVGEDKLRRLLEDVAYGREIDDLPKLYLAHGDSLLEAKTRLISQEKEGDDWLLETHGVFLASATDFSAPLFTIGLRIDGRA
jgi:hypothetical protein